ncbi:MAG: cation-translocating P-type ATPase [Legionellaceae bacterium]|nr:cation-translocating P-type ATPase [Legionellaceae bacterium]MBP9775508.1 cation-translocating P-type ATPase [Legionellaceae bacterium]
MTTFVFPLKGVTCSGCKGNLIYLLDVDTKPEYFKFKHIDVSSNLQKLVVEVEDNDIPISEEEVRRYINHTLAGSDYELIVEGARYYWILGSLGLVIGTIILILAVTNGLVLWPVKLLTATVSVGLSLLLGAESFRKAKIEWQRRKPAMDSLFLMSTGAATLMSLFGLVMPSMPLMFEASLLILGFRHIGIALKKSIYSTPNLPVHYQRLQTNNLSRTEDQDDTFVPGEALTIQAGQMLPVDGWLLPKQNALIDQTYAMNVQRIRGAYLPEHLRVDDAVMAGMVAQTDCVMQVGLGHKLSYFEQKPKNTCPKGQIWVYPEGNEINVVSRSDRDNKAVHFVLSSVNLTDRAGNCYFATILNALKLGTVLTHLSKPHQQLLSRALVQHADAMGLLQTTSSLARLEKELEDAGCRAAPIQDKADQILEYFVPVVLGVALISGAVVMCFFSPMIAVRCMISILVSACPCTLGFVTPLVMDFARAKGKQAGVVFSQSDAIQRFTEVDTVLLDIHGTATKGEPVARVMVHEPDRLQEIETHLARMEQHSDHHVGKAIYTAVKGDDLLLNTERLRPTDIEKYPGGIGASVQGKHYILGNYNLAQQFGVTLENPGPNRTYLLEQAGAGYQCIATVELHDPLRSDAALTVEQLKYRGLKVFLFTGADEQTANQYAQALPGLDGVYSGLADAQAKVEKLRSIQTQHRVLMIGDGANDGPAMKEAYASIAMKHALSDEGAQYQAKARILNGNMLTVVDALDIASQAMWRINFNLYLSLIYNLAIVILTNSLVLALGLVLHPGVCAALMVIQVGFIILSSYYFKQQPLPTQSLLVQSSMFGMNPSLASGNLSVQPTLPLTYANVLM